MPDRFPKAVGRNNRHSIRLLEVASKFRKDFVITDANRHGDTKLILHPQANLMRFLFSVFDGETRIGEIDPTLIQAKALYPV